ncbi:MAG: amidohydrolase [Reyranella sp.]|nr:amidohydrolase [Reyranella sp.]
MKAGFKVLDSDLHTFEPQDLWIRYLDDRFADRVPDLPRRRPEAAPASPRHPLLAAAAAAGYDPPSHLAAMDVEGIDVAVLFGTRGRHVQMYDDIDPDYAAALARAHNEWSRDFCAAAPDRLKFAAQIAYHDVSQAVREVRRAVDDLGAVAVVGNPNPVNGRHVHDACFEPLWQAIEELGVPYCFHPTGVWTLKDDIGRRFSGQIGAHLLADAARNPIELMLAFASLVAGGVLERHPGLVCAFLEGGCGWLPWWLERLDDTIEKFPENIDVPLSLKPSGYFQRQCFVGAEASERGLPHVVAALGDATVVFATDYPHRDSLFPKTTDTLIARADIADDAKRRILWDNPLRLYRRADLSSMPPLMHHGGQR